MGSLLGLNLLLLDFYSNCLDLGIKKRRPCDLKDIIVWVQKHPLTVLNTLQALCVYTVLRYALSKGDNNGTHSHYSSLQML